MKGDIHAFQAVILYPLSQAVKMLELLRGALRLSQGLLSSLAVTGQNPSDKLFAGLKRSSKQMPRSGAKCHDCIEISLCIGAC